MSKGNAGRLPLDFTGKNMGDTLFCFHLCPLTCWRVPTWHWSAHSLSIAGSWSRTGTEQSWKLNGTFSKCYLYSASCVVTMDNQWQARRKLPNWVNDTNPLTCQPWNRYEWHQSCSLFMLCFRSSSWKTSKLVRHVRKKTSSKRKQTRGTDRFSALPLTVVH